MNLAVVQFLNTLFLLKIVWGEWLVFFNEYHEVPWVREAPQLSAKMLLCLLVIRSVIKDKNVSFQIQPNHDKPYLVVRAVALLSYVSPQNEINISDCSVVRETQKS